MKRAAQITAVLTLIASGLAWAAGRGHWIAALWVGAAWGVANAWVLTQAAQCVTSRQGWRLGGWLALKFVGLYGAAAWMLVGLKIPALGWLAGFTVSLVALAASAFPALRQMARPSFIGVFSAGIINLGLISLARASEVAHDAAAAGGHGEGAAEPAHPPEIPNFITLIAHNLHGPVGHFLHTWENSIFALVIVGLVGAGVALGARTLVMIPGRGQTFLEMLVEGLDNMVCGVLGKEHGRRFLPFLGTLFIFILTMNLAGLIPGLKSPTSRFEMTFSLALCVFFMVQWTAIQSYGFFGYIYHLMNEPKDPVGWVLAPLMFFIEAVGEIVKPVSLALRLFGNIMGEDTLLGVFVMLGALSMSWSHLPIGVPMHLPFILLAIIFSSVQALVFTSLSMIYIYTKLPHEEH